VRGGEIAIDGAGRTGALGVGVEVGVDRARERLLTVELECRGSDGLRHLGNSALIFLVDEVASDAIGADVGRVVSAAQLSLVSGVSVEVPQLAISVGVLTLGAITAPASFLKGSALFCLVAAGRFSGTGD